MSSPFYKYLSEKIVTHFITNTPQIGDKFYVQFETEEQVEKLYDELRENTISHSFAYVDSSRDQKYETYQLCFGEVDLIVAAAMSGGPHPDFLATLRNLVGVDQQYFNKAILFIHCSSLDSILGGAGSLSKEGMPLNIGVVERDIKRKIGETGYSSIDKKILEFYLDNKRKELDGSTASIFEYEDLICSLNDSQITKEEYRVFELFYDDSLVGVPEKKIRDRLEYNHENYVKVSEIHSYGVDDAKLERYYGESGAKALSKPEWESISFPEVEKFIASRKSKSSIEYIPIISDLLIWDKEEGSSKAKSRVRNIIIFATDESVKLSLSFTEFTKKSGIEVPKAYQNCLKCDASGKKLNVELLDVEDKAAFFQFKYNGDGTRFVFKIAVLRCSPALLSGIKTQYSIEMKGGMQSAIRINTEEDEVVFNDFGSNEISARLVEQNQVVPVNVNDKVSLLVGDEYPYSEDNEDVLFIISTEDFSIPMIKAFAIDPPTVIEGLKVWYLKRAKKNSFELFGDNSLVLGTKRYFARDEFRRTLDLERKFIQLGMPFVVENNENAPELNPITMNLPDAVQASFDSIIQYFVSKRTIPSLAYIDDELADLYSKYLVSIIESIKLIPDGSYLSEEDKNIFYLGMVKRQYGDYEILLSPLHPINVAYQLYIRGQNIEGLEDSDIDLLRKFQHTALLPYINIDPFTGENVVYIPIEQIHSPEWKVYVDETLPRYKGSKDFVSKLVSDKIREFVEHFSYLFSKDTNAPIRINLINTGDCKEIVQGIVKYIVKQLNDSGSKSVIPIHVTMYSATKMDTAFGLISQIDNAEIVASTLDLNIHVDNLSIDDLIDIYRRNVYFYYKDIDEELDYAHITFMELDDDNQSVSTVMNDIPSGVVMNGISSGVPSELLGDTYRTGFGTRFANVNSPLMEIAIGFNAINAAMNGETYRADNCYAMKMSMTKQKVLDRVYEASNWVTFINPKVDLNYFKSDPSAKDLLIIHYSDQYNMTSSGYDAITVTKKSKQYQNAITNYLKHHGVDEAEAHSKRIINMFNALNGDWLLRMLSYKSHFSVEKLSILSAMKFAVKRYAVPGIIWIPVSLEEILRVSGSVGLSQNESSFSRKNLGFDGGVTSDDLLLVGIKPGENIQIAFYPIEVKIGKVASDYLDKGIQQALKTSVIFEEVLETGPCEGKDIKTRLYRNFFIQQILVNAGKMLLYEVGDGRQGWEQVVNTDLRRRLLGEDYEIVSSLVPNMGKAGVISFREECNHEREFRTQDVLIVEKSKKEGINILAESFENIDTVNWDLVKDEADTALHPEDESDASGDIEPHEEPEELDADSSLIEPDDTHNHDIRVLIGKDQYLHNVYWEFGHKDLANRHVLITGASGHGKTYAIQTMLYELAKCNVPSVIFDYTEGFRMQHLDDSFKERLAGSLEQRIVYNTGVPINPFVRHEIDLDGEIIRERSADVASRLADIFVHVYKFGSQQYSAIFEATMNGLDRYGDGMNMRLFQDELELIAEENKAAKTVISKLSPFFCTVDFNSDPSFDWGNLIYSEDAKVNIIQLTAFSSEMQVAIIEMMLWDLWYYASKFGTKDKPFVVVLDEAQNLSHESKSPSTKILTEGRKFGWSAWLATQSLRVFSEETNIRLMQSAFKMYFKPTELEMDKIVKQLNSINGTVDWNDEVHKLKKGQAIVIGDKLLPNGSFAKQTPIVTSITSFDERQ